MEAGDCPSLNMNARMNAVPKLSVITYLLSECTSGSVERTCLRQFIHKTLLILIVNYISGGSDSLKNQILFNHVCVRHEVWVLLKKKRVPGENPFGT